MIGANGEGINCTAETCSHELKHQSNYKNWKGQPDFDKDGVPDSEEGKAPYYFHPEKPDTYNLAATIDPEYAGYGDNEFLTRIAEQSPGTVSPNNDWSDINGRNINK